jgi:hypothetical protein
VSLSLGDVVLEWNGVTLTGKTHEEVQRIVNDTPAGVELELLIRWYVLIIAGL